MPEALDRLSSLLERFRVRARLFHHGPLCGVTHFDAAPGRGFLHVMRRGPMTLTHAGRRGAPRKLQLDEPALLLYPRPLEHDFHTAADRGADFSCATLDFEGGAQHPLVRALPPLVCLPLARVDGVADSVALLFAEADRPACGARVLLDRLFEVVLIQVMRWMLDHPEDSGIGPGALAGLADARLARALVALHQSPAMPWDLPRLAAQAGMSRSAFARAFRDAVGQTPAAYVADWRMTLARQALREGQRVQQVADTLGFASASAFTRLFTQRVGASPRDWRAAQEADLAPLASVGHPARA